MKKHNAYRRLSNLLSGLEQGILNAKDKDVLSIEGTDLIAKKVKSIINDRLEAHSTQIAEGLPDDASERRRLLEVIVGARSGLPADIRVAYKGGRKISDEEVSALLNKLLRRGYLQK